MRKHLSLWQKWWKKEMLIALIVFVILVAALVTIKFTLQSAPFLPLVIVFFLTFLLLFIITLILGRKTHQDKI
jgi:hypothetical protein